MREKIIMAFDNYKNLITYGFMLLNQVKELNWIYL
jgi:hypothetical protein